MDYPQDKAGHDDAPIYSVGGENTRDLNQKAKTAGEGKSYLKRKVPK